MTKKIKVTYAEYYVKQCTIEIEVPKTTKTSNVLDFVERNELSQNINYEMEKAQLEKIPEVDYMLTINDKKVLCDKYKNTGGLMQLIGQYEYDILKK
jgi:hypothetical protein